ncbi:hypothetical protein LTS18_010206, partial [Coniosporium uncinatum]
MAAPAPDQGVQPLPPPVPRGREDVQTQTPQYRGQHLSPHIPPTRNSNRSSYTFNLLPNLFNGDSQATNSDDRTLAHRAAALRQLNGIPFRSRVRHRQQKSASSRTSLSSQPVLVRTYSGSRSRPNSRVRSPVPPPMSSEALPSDAKLPPVEAFSFDGILRAVDPEIHDSIDAIAEIYAKSKLSMADEYSAHLPPQGEISERDGMHAVPPHRIGLSDRALTTVTEASSSSERLVGGGNSKASTSSGKGKTTAYGSLQNIMVGTTRGDATYHKRSASDFIA